MAKLTFDEVIEKLGEERTFKASEVLASVLDRKVWINEWHIPGCLSETFGINLTKADAIASAISCAEDENGAPRGMKTALAKFGRFDSKSPLYGDCVNTVSKMTIAELLS